MMPAVFRTKPNVPALSVLLWAMLTVPVQAATELNRYLTVSGFGTLGVAQSDSANTQYVNDRQATGTTNRLDFNLDSNLGLQATARANTMWSATMQVLARHRMQANITMEVEWAFLKFEPSSNLSMRIGRMAMPTFAVSDFRHVGFANLWIRPPNEVYTLAFLERLQGADASYRLPLLNHDLQINVFAGNSYLYGPTNSQIDVSHVRGVNVSWEQDGISARIGQIRSQVNLTTTPDRYIFNGLSLGIDKHNWVWQSEYVWRDSRDFANSVNSRGWYVLLGRHIQRFTPYVMHGDTRPNSQPSAFKATYAQRTSAVGVRWDWHDNAALKFQVDHVETDHTPGASFIRLNNNQPLTGPGPAAGIDEPVNVFALALNVVF